jgi:hypothetical protein
MRSDDSRPPTAKQAYWLKHLRDCEASGQPLTTYAAAHDMAPQHLYTWRSRLRALGLLPAETTNPKKPASKKPAQRRRHRRLTPPGFIAARVVTDERPPWPTGLRIRFPNGVWLEVGSSTQATSDPRLLSLLAAL